MDTRTLIVSVALMTLGMGGVSAFAQHAPGEARPEARRQDNRPAAGANLDRAIEQLELTDEQKKQVDPIMTEMRERVRTAVQESQQKLAKVLTGEQQTKLRELMRGDGQPAARGNPVDRLQKAVKDLNLTEEQSAKIKEIFASYQPQLEAIRKGADNDRQAMQESRPLMQEMRSKVNAILTPEQTEKLQKEMAPRGERAPAKDRPADGKRPNRDGAKQDNL